MLKRYALFADRGERLCSAVELFSFVISLTRLSGKLVSRRSVLFKSQKICETTIIDDEIGSCGHFAAFAGSEFNVEIILYITIPKGKLSMFLAQVGRENGLPIEFIRYI